MAGFRLSRDYTMPKEEVHTAAEALADDLSSRFNLSCRWNGERDRVTFKGSGAKGELNITETCVNLKIELGFLAAAFERPLKEAANEFLDEHMY